MNMMMGFLGSYLEGFAPWMMPPWLGARAAAAAGLAVAVVVTVCVTVETEKLAMMECTADSLGKLLQHALYDFLSHRWGKM